MPLLKKPSLSKDDTENYRSVSNLNFVSKMIEKVIKNRIRSHLERNDISNQHQSAYKKFHSTETALLKVENDIVLNTDEGRVTALTLLDLSVSFDTLDHSSITNLLSTWYGIEGIALDWFVRSQTEGETNGLFIQSSRSRMRGSPRNRPRPIVFFYLLYPP